MTTLGPELVLPEGIELPVYYSSLSPTMVSKTGRLPHWEQKGRTVFVTFRLADSIPAEKRARWEDERCAWAALQQPAADVRSQEYERFSLTKMEAWLDRGYGDCLLENELVRCEVESVLRQRDGMDYRLYSFVVMPNHVHVCFMPLGTSESHAIVQAWKSIAARRINKVLRRSGSVWQKEYFDRYIRNAQHFDRVIRYIHRNDPRIAWSVLRFVP